MRASMHEYQHLNIRRFEYQQMSTNIFNTKKLLVVSGAEGKHVQKKNNHGEHHQAVELCSIWWVQVWGWPFMLHHFLEPTLVPLLQLVHCSSCSRA